MYIIQYNGFTLQNDSNHTIDSLTGISRVDIRRSEDFLTGGEGGNIWERKYGMRVINIGGEIYSDDISDYYQKRSDLLNAFSKDATATILTIKRSDGQSFTINAKVADMPDISETPGEYGEGAYSISLKCENPFFNDVAQTITITPSTAGGTPVSSPVPSPVGSIGGNGYITNVGDVSATASFVITGQITNPSITNLTTGKSFTLNTSFATGQTVSIYQNTGGFFVVSNGSNFYQYFIGEFFDFIVGSNALKFSGSSFDSSASLTVTFNNNYIGI